MYDGKLDTFWSQGYETGPHGVSYVFNTPQVVSKVSIIRRGKIIFLVAFKDMDLNVSHFLNLEQLIPAGFTVAKGSIF